MHGLEDEEPDGHAIDFRFGAGAPLEVPARGVEHLDLRLGRGQFPYQALGDVLLGESGGIRAGVVTCRVGEQQAQRQTSHQKQSQGEHAELALQGAVALLSRFWGPRLGPVLHRGHGSHLLNWWAIHRSISRT